MSPALSVNQSIKTYLYSASGVFRISLTKGASNPPLAPFPPSFPRTLPTSHPIPSLLLPLQKRRSGGFYAGKFFKSAIAVGEFWCIFGGLVTTYNCIVSEAESFKIGMFHEGHVVEINVGVIKTGLIMLVCLSGLQV